MIVASLFAAAPAQAAPGDLDPSFSQDGMQVTRIAASDSGNDVALQADGKIVVVGGSYAGAGGTTRFALTRFMRDGSLDSSFDGDGRVTSDFGNAAAVAVALQPNGTDPKIVAAGGEAVARYLPDGSLDASFGGGGKVTTDFAVFDVKVDGDGRVVVAGYGGGGLVLARYSGTDGSPDPSFGVDGKVRTDFNGGSGIAVQDDGKIVAVGSAPGFGGMSDLALVRYNANGSLDTSFGRDGTQITDYDWGGDDALAGVAIGSDGTIATVGQSYCFICSSTSLIVAAYNRDGSLRGLRATDVGGLDSGSSVAIQSDGKIVAAGATAEDFLVGRYDSVGNADPSFHDDGLSTNLGVRTIDFGGSDGAGGVAIQPDGKIVAAGTSTTYGADGSATSRIAIARYEGGSASGTAPVNSAPPTVSGIAAEGQTLTATAGAWTGTTPIDLRYQWRRCDSGGANCVDVAAASPTTYALTTADIGHTIRVRVTASNAYGQLSVDSAPTAVVNGNPPVNSTPPTIAGTATEGQTLRANSGRWTGTAPITLSYRWRRCDATGANCGDIAGASAASYVLVAADVGHAIRLRETATNGYGTASVDSAATATVKPRPGDIVGQVTNTKKTAIGGATVNCGTAGTATTSSMGAYSITAVPPGSYYCTASATGYLAQGQSVKVGSASRVTVNFSLARR